jgi:glutamyl-tRNA synthetase
VPDGDGVAGFDDLVFGRHELRLRDIEDFVIVRSTGEPLYIQSNVVDDHRDRITHVIRGGDHLMNTPKQVLIYQALDWPVPQFAHMALTLDPQKAKISKRRHGEVVAVQFYRDHGFLPWAFANFMALLGWSPGDDREVFLHRDELMAAFSLERLNKTNSVFNYRKDDPKFITDPKAIHINAQHIRGLPIDELLPAVQAQLERAGIFQPEWGADGAQRGWFAATVDLIRARYHLLTDFTTLGRAYFADDFELEDKAKKSLTKDPALAGHLPRLADRYAALDRFDLESAEAALRALADELGVKAGLLINGARAAVSGQAVGPGIFELMVAIGQPRTIERLRRTPALMA